MYSVVHSFIYSFIIYYCFYSIEQLSDPDFDFILKNYCLTQTYFSCDLILMHLIDRLILLFDR